MRATIRKAVPKAEESISYKIPTYKLRGERLLYFAGWKQHYSLYPATKRLLAALQRRSEAIRGRQEHGEVFACGAGAG